MTRFARDHRVYFFEEPEFVTGEPRLRMSVCADSGVMVVTPLLPPGLSAPQISSMQRDLLLQLIEQEQLSSYAAWYYTPMAMEFTSVLDPILTVYDCMDELTGFTGAPANMRANEQALFQQADLVFTGGASLYEAKRKQHGSAHLFPSSVDTKHFARARSVGADPLDQRAIPRPRIGYAGVIDERMDLQLLAKVASLRPEWQLVLIGPVVKISPDSIPQLPNIHLLGMKKYAELPDYLGNWDIAILPFALNDATRFISPTKTPEYLAAGLRVVSTPIRDVVSPYGELGLVSIAEDAKEFIAAAETMLPTPADEDFQARVDQFLSKSSWDSTWEQMEELMKNEWTRKSSNSGHEAESASALVPARGLRHV